MLEHQLNFDNANIALNSCVILDLIYIPVGNYTPVMVRPYKLNVTTQAIDTISSKLEEHKSLTPNVLNSISGQILTNEPVGFQSQIDNSWVTTKKFIFLLKVKTVDDLVGEIISYIQGYTQYDGISMTSGHIDTNLVHYINNVIETSHVTFNTPFGVERQEKLYKVYNVIKNENFNELYLQRPCDVLENINILNMESMNNENVYNQYNVYNYEGMLNNFKTSPSSSYVGNNIPTEYLSGVINSGLQMQMERSILTDSISINGQGSSSLIPVEPSIQDNKFLKYMSRSAGHKVVQSKFGFNELMALDPTIYNRFTVINPTKTVVDPILNKTPEVGDYWVGQDIVTLKAYSLIESSISLALKYGFNKMFFAASNMSNVTGQTDIYITNFNSFINLNQNDITLLLELFKTKFLQEIFLNETNAGTIPMHMEMYVDLLGTTKIYLQVSGYPANWYTVPGFASSLFAPVVVNDNDLIKTNAAYFNSLVDHIVSNRPSINQQTFYNNY